MMQMFSFNFGFDSASRAHFRPESIQRFIYFIKFNTLYSCKEWIRAILHFVCIIHLIGHIFIMQLFSINFGF